MPERVSKAPGGPQRFNEASGDLATHLPAGLRMFLPGAWAEESRTASYGRNARGCRKIQACAKAGVEACRNACFDNAFKHAAENVTVAEPLMSSTRER
jgi:hypothetical protein